MYGDFGLGFACMTLVVVCYCVEFVLFGLCWVLRLLLNDGCLWGVADYGFGCVVMDWLLIALTWCDSLICVWLGYWYVRFVFGY